MQTAASPMHLFRCSHTKRQTEGHLGFSLHKNHISPKVGLCLRANLPPAPIPELIAIEPSLHKSIGRIIHPECRPHEMPTASRATDIGRTPGRRIDMNPDAIIPV